MPVHEDAAGGFRQTFSILLAAVGFILLIACANVANMVLTRAAERVREIALRTALGAGLAHLLRQILTEILCTPKPAMSLSLAEAGIPVRRYTAGELIFLLSQQGVQRIAAFCLARPEGR